MKKKKYTLHSLSGSLLLICLHLFVVPCLVAQDADNIQKDQELVFSLPPGFYTEPIELGIYTQSGDSVYYTLNGSEPRPGSEGCYLYTTPVALKNRSCEANGISMVRSLPEDIQHKWTAPEENVFKANVVRARSYCSGHPSSGTLTATYFISEDIFGRYSMPLLSVTSNEENLFNFDTGIYVPGVNWNPAERRDKTGNYFMTGKAWERGAHIEFFSTTGELLFSQDAGIRIHGGNSRVGPQKSIKVYARSEYNKSWFEYRLFPDVDLDCYKRFVLQTTDQTWKVGIFIDDIIHDLARDITDGMASRPCITFINGEYWGIYKIRERIDKYYIASHYKVDEDEIDLLESCWMIEKEGSRTEFANFISYIEQNDLRDARTYAYVKEKIDVDQFIDYLSTEIYFANYDWPMGNIKYWKEQCDTAKWRWLLYDLDQGGINYEANMFEHATLEGGSSWPNPDRSTLLYRSLMKNEEFTAKLIARLLFLMEHDFSPQKVIEKIDEYTAMYEPELKEHYDRWKTGGSMQRWYRETEQMKSFARYRPLYLKSHMIDFFDIDSMRISSLSVQPRFLVFPNPCGNLLAMEFQDPNIHFENYIIHDVYGRIALSGDLEPGKIVYHLDLSSLPKGSYILRVQSATEILYRTIIKTER